MCVYMCVCVCVCMFVCVCLCVCVCEMRGRFVMGLVLLVNSFGGREEGRSASIACNLDVVLWSGKSCHLHLYSVDVTV